MSKLTVLGVCAIFLMAMPCLAATATLYPVADTYTSGIAPGCFGDSTTVMIGNLEEHGHDERAMFCFDMTDLIGMNITSAIFNIKPDAGCLEHQADVNVFDILAEWDETYDGGHVTHGDTTFAERHIGSLAWKDMDITGLVQLWADGAKVNNGFVLNPTEGSGDWTFHSREAEADKPYLTVEYGPENTCAMVGMPADSFKAGDTCSCTVRVFNEEETVLEGYPLFVVLDVFGQYFFGPGFTETPQHYLSLYPQFEMGLTEVEVLPEFTWPDLPGTVTGIQWISALTTPEMDAVFGDISMFTFGWGE